MITLSLFTTILNSDISTLIEAVKNNEDISQIHEKLVDDVIIHFLDYRLNLFTYFVLILYDFNFDECLKGICKCTTLKADNMEIKPVTNIEVLRRVWFIIAQFYSNEDCMQVVEKIKKMAEAQKEIN